MVQSFRDLRTWQEAHALSLIIYRATNAFPESERYILVSQMRRAAVSVTSNIAEGMGRYGRKDTIRFFIQARGSTQELLSQIEVSKDLGFLETSPYGELRKRYEGLAAGINAHIRSITQ